MNLNELATGRTFVLFSSVESITQSGVRLTDNGQPIGLRLYCVGMKATIDDPGPSEGKTFVMDSDGRIHQMGDDTRIVPCG